MSSHAPGSEARDERFGSLVADRYVVGGIIGQGRAGTVYAAQGRLDPALLAIKILRPALSRSRMHVDRFLESARMTASVGHPGVVRVIDVGHIPGDSVYVVTERLMGTDLRRLIAAHGKLAWSRARPIALSVCAALCAAHARELIHGALDPSRCIVLPPEASGGDEMVKLLDFGIAGEGSGPEIWPAAPAYRPPERRQGEPASARGDVFAAGALVFEMLSGRAPKPGESLRAGDPRVPEALDEAVTKALARDPSRRFRTAAALEEALAAIDRDGQAHDRPASAGASSPAAPARARRSAPPDEEDITRIRSDRRAPTGPLPAAAPVAAAPVAAPPVAQPFASRSAGRASNVRPSPHVPEDPTPPPMIAPALAAPGAPRVVARGSEPEPEDRTSLLGGGFRLPAQEQTSVLAMPQAPPTPASPGTDAGRSGPVAVAVDDGPEPTLVVEFRAPGAGMQTGVHAITHRPPGAPREETAVLDVSDLEVRDLAASTAILELPVMREQTQVLGMELSESEGDPSISMTAVIESPLGGRGVSGAIHTSESVVPQLERSGPLVAVAPQGYGAAARGAPPPGGHAQIGASHPPVSGGHPPVSGGHPPVSGGHPLVSGGYPPVSGGYPPVSGGYPPVSGGYPPVSGGYPPVSGGYPVSGGHPPMSGGYPASRPPGSGASIAVPSSQSPRARSRDRGMFVGVALGVLIAVAILGGGAIAGLWVASK